MTAATDPALLAAVLEKPDDDTVRLVYADAVEEAGDEDRATFIRTQIELSWAKPTRTVTRPVHTDIYGPGLPVESVVVGHEWSAEVEENRLRETEILKAHGERWAWPVPVQSYRYEFRRGFVEVLTTNADRWHDAAAEILALHPVRTVRFDGTGRVLSLYPAPDYPTGCWQAELAYAHGGGHPDAMTWESRVQMAAGVGAWVSERLRPRGYRYLIDDELDRRSDEIDAAVAADTVRYFAERAAREEAAARDQILREVLHREGVELPTEPYSHSRRDLERRLRERMIEGVELLDVRGWDGRHRVVYCRCNDDRPWWRAIGQTESSPFPESMARTVNIVPQTWRTSWPHFDRPEQWPPGRRHIDHHVGTGRCGGCGRLYVAIARREERTTVDVLRPGTFTFDTDPARRVALNDRVGLGPDGRVVPVTDGPNVIGYVTNVRPDGDRVVADVVITDPPPR